MINSDPRAENIDKRNMRVTFDGVGLQCVCVCVCARARFYWQNVTVRNILRQIGKSEKQNIQLVWPIVKMYTCIPKTLSLS